MATETINIVVQENGSRVVKRSLEEVGQAGKVASEGVEFLKHALEALAVFEIVKQLQEAVDTMTRMNNMLSTVATSTQNQIGLNEALFATAQKTRTEYEQTVELYTRLAQNTKATGISQQDLMKVTTTLNEVIKISGVNAQHAKNGIMELSEGMAMGALRGQQLRAMIIDIPLLGAKIAEGMGLKGGAAELKHLGEEGKLSGKVLEEALLKVGPQVEEMFRRTRATISDGLTVLHNAFVKFIGDGDQGTGVSKALAEALIWVADHLKLITALLIPLGVALFEVFGPGLLGLLGAATEAVLGFTAALLTNPFTLILTGLAAAISAIMLFGDQVNVVSDGSANLRDVLMAVFSFIGDGFKFVGGLIVDVWNWATGAVNDKSSGIQKFFKDVVDFIVNYWKSQINLIIGLWVFAYNEGIAAWNGLGPALKDIGISAVNGLIDVIETGVNRIAGAIMNGPLAAFLGGKGAELVHLDRLKNDAEGAADAFSKLSAENAKVAFGTDWTGNALAAVSSAVLDRAKEIHAANANKPTGTAPSDAKGPDNSLHAEEKRKVTRGSMIDDFVLHAEDLKKEAGLDYTIAAATKEVDKLDEQLQKKFGEGAKLSGDERQKLMDYAQAALDAAEVGKVRNEILKEQIEPQREYERHLTAANQLLKEGKISQEAYNEEMLKADMIKLANRKDAGSGAARARDQIGLEQLDVASRVQQAEVAIWQAANGPALQYTASMKALDDLMAHGMLTNQQYEKSVRDIRIAYLDTQQDAMSGFERGILKVQQQMNDAASMMEQTVTDAFKNAEDALMNFMDTGKLNLKQFFDDLWKDMARQQIRQNILGPIANALHLNIPGLGGQRGQEISNPLYVQDVSAAKLPGLGGSGQNATNPVMDAIKTQGGKLGDVLSWARETLSNAFNNLTNGLGNLFSSVINNLSSAFNAVVNAIQQMANSSGGSGGGGGGNWLSSIMSIFGGGGGGGSTYEAGVPEDTIAFATGGSFTVGGSGGVDSQMVRFRASPGERVSVGRPGQDDAAQGGNVTVSITVDARGAGLDVDQKIHDAITQAAPVIVQAARQQSRQDTNNLMTRQKL